jgi:hypothetical protein
MNGTSLMVTGGLGSTVATVAAVLDWGFNGFPKPVPSNVELAIAAAIIFAAHAVYFVGLALAKKWSLGLPPTVTTALPAPPTQAAPATPSP